jgi:type II secretory ATPase GspE/PulE/Tfp pilus assembly ATPase PilB-like protein
MVLRLLYKDTTKNSDLVTLGWHISQAVAFKRLKAKPYGINIISGPTGSGKSTTLQKILVGIIQEVAGKLHVLTVEDPPEYPVKGATMIPVANAPDEKSRATAFHAAIRAALRQDPDILMIGEMRDAPAARLAFQCAMTGHPTYSTLHANSPLDILDRLIDIGVERNLVYDHEIVTGLISQRLVPVICPKCRSKIEEVADHFDAQDVNRLLAAFKGHQTYVKNPAGCEHCKNTGLVDRTAIAQVMETSEELMHLVKTVGKPAANAHFVKNGGLSIAAHAHMKVAAGLIDPFAAEREVGYFAFEHGEFARQLLSRQQARVAVQLA